MRTVLLFLFSFFMVSNVYADATSCQTLACVRQHIDLVDGKIVKLIGVRLAYVRRAGELKQGHLPVYDPVREKKILEIVGQQALAVGYPSSIAIAVFQTILRQSEAYEKSTQ